jgi:hypothetical protein
MYEMFYSYISIAIMLIVDKKVKLSYILKYNKLDVTSFPCASLLDLRQRQSYLNVWM